MYLALGWIGESPKTVQIDQDHPLLKNCVSFTEDEIEEISKNGTDDELILALRSCLRYNVARIAGKWEATIPYIDDMISVGMLAIVQYVARRHTSTSEYSTMKQATSAIINALEEFLNSNQSLSAPSTRDQKRRLARGEDPLYLQAITNDYSDVMLEERDPDTYKRDVMEALELLNTDELDEAILRQSSWSKTHTELAKALGVSKSTILRRRERLYHQFLKLTE